MRGYLKRLPVLALALVFLLALLPVGASAAGVGTVYDSAKAEVNRPFEWALQNAKEGGRFELPSNTTLPPGLSLSPDGIISGTPTETGDYEFKVSESAPGVNTMHYCFLSVYLPEADDPKAETEILYSGECGDGLSWTIDGSGLLTISGTGDMWDFDPYGYDEDDRECPWSPYAREITALDIQEGITSIGDYAFDDVVFPFNNGFFNTILIPASVEHISPLAFRGAQFYNLRIADGNSAYCTQNNVLYSADMSKLVFCPSDYFQDTFIVPSGVTAIGDYAFVQCIYIDSIRLPDSVTSIGEFAFQWCSFDEISIPKSVVSIDPAAFSFCTHLTDILVSEDNPAYLSVDGVLFSADGTVLIKYPVGKTETAYTLPAGVTKIASSAFDASSSLTEIILHEGVTEIGASAFFGFSGLKQLTLPLSLTGVGYYAFWGCSGLTDVWYGGNGANWAAMNIEPGNDPLINAAVHYNEQAPEPSPAPEAPAVQVSTQKLAVDGEEKEIEHYNIDGSNYFKLRDLACLLIGTEAAFDVGYDPAARTITVTTGAVYTPLPTDLQPGEDQSASAVVSSQALSIDGKTVSLTAYNIGGSNYFMLRDLAPYLGFSVDYDAGTRTALILTK